MDPGEHREAFLTDIQANADGGLKARVRLTMGVAGVDALDVGWFSDVETWGTQAASPEEGHMHTQSRGRALVKFLFWTIATIVVFVYAINTYRSGQMVRWYYFQARADGYAINAKTFEQATRENPVSLVIGDFADVTGLRAVRVTKGSRLPEGTNGVIDLATVDQGDRVRIDGGQLVVAVPWQIKEAKGFKFRDGFTHKNIRTNPYSGLWNLVMVGLVGLCLGFLAEGFTDLLGLKFQKIDHSVGH